MTVHTTVEITREARKTLQKAPIQIRKKLIAWARDVQLFGLETVRKAPAYHDEPLKGERKGQRSIRLNLQWRAIYTETKDQSILVTILEVTTHDYRTR